MGVDPDRSCIPARPCHSSQSHDVRCDFLQQGDCSQDRILVPPQQRHRSVGTSSRLGTHAEDNSLRWPRAHPHRLRPVAGARAGLSQTAFMRIQPPLIRGEATCSRRRWFRSSCRRSSPRTSSGPRRVDLFDPRQEAAHRRDAPIRPAPRRSARIATIDPERPPDTMAHDNPAASRRLLTWLQLTEAAAPIWWCGFFSVVPIPARRSMTPLRSRSAYAWRITERLTPSFSASSGSAGSLRSL